MTDSRSPDQEAATQKLASAAKNMKGGMSTVNIMRVLFESDLALKSVGGSLNAMVQQAIVLDGLAADTRTKLNTDFKEGVDALRQKLGDTQENIARLSSVKTATQLAQNYYNQSTPIAQAVQELDEARTSMLKQAEDFVKELRAAYKELGESVSDNSNTQEARQKIQTLSQQLQTMRKEATKRFSGKGMGNVQHSLNILHREVERSTAVSAPAAQTPKLQ